MYRLKLPNTSTLPSVCNTIDATGPLKPLPTMKDPSYCPVPSNLMMRWELAPLKSKKVPPMRTAPSGCTMISLTPPPVGPVPLPKLPKLGS